MSDTAAAVEESLGVIRVAAQRGLEAVQRRKSPRSDLARIIDELRRLGPTEGPRGGTTLEQRIADLELEARRMRDNAETLATELDGSRRYAAARARLCDARRSLELASLQLRGAKSAALRPRA